MASRTDLFVEAFGGDSGERDGREAGEPVAKNSTELMLLAFGQDGAKRDYVAPIAVDYEMMDSARSADSGKLLMLDQAMKAGVQYRDLQVGLRALVKPSRPLAKELRKEQDETGYTLEQRQTAFDALQFNVDYLASLADAGLPASMIAAEYKKLKERFPEQAIDQSLQETNQQVLAQLKAQEKAQEYAEETEAQQAQQAVDEEQVRAELKAAQEAIAAMGNPLVNDAVARGSELN